MIGDAATGEPLNQAVSATPSMGDLSARISDARQCNAALAELRTFTVSDSTVAFLSKHMQAHPSEAGCTAMYLAARLLENEQIKMLLDQQFASEVDEAIGRFPGTPEAELLTHALAVTTEFGAEREIEAASNYFQEQADRRNAAEKFPHFRVLKILGQWKLAQRRSKTEALATEVTNLASEHRSSLMLRRLAAQLSG